MHVRSHVFSLIDWCENRVLIWSSASFCEGAGHSPFYNWRLYLPTSAPPSIPASASRSSPMCTSSTTGATSMTSSFHSWEVIRNKRQDGECLWRDRVEEKYVWEKKREIITSLNVLGIPNLKGEVGMAVSKSTQTRVVGNLGIVIHKVHPYACFSHYGAMSRSTCVTCKASYFSLPAAYLWTLLATWWWRESERRKGAGVLVCYL